MVYPSFKQVFEVDPRSNFGERLLLTTTRRTFRRDVLAYMDKMHIQPNVWLVGDEAGDEGRLRSARPDYGRRVPKGWSSSVVTR
jgi:hypothetical protein